MDNPVGNVWLKQTYDIHNHNITHNSYLGTRPKIEIDENGDIIELYPNHYAPGKTPLDHIEFALKYDDLNLDFLKEVIGRIPQNEFVEYIQLKPRGGYERRIGFLYEFLTGIQLPLTDQGKGNYIDLLDSERYVTGKIVKNQRWNINDNLLGNANFCPVIRITKALKSILQEDYKKLIEEIALTYPPEIYYRAVNYLYTKETRSSYQIENEKPTTERINRFVRLLEKAGEQSVGTLLGEKNLTALQNNIVDPRYAASGFRDFQNYIGQTTYNYKELIHYICPPPDYLLSIMDGLLSTAEKTDHISPVIRAAIIAFGFVFAHPFEDGNGRLHRFLIHDTLVRGKFVPQGMIIPVSAHMVNHIKEYDKTLESFSTPLMKRIQYEVKNDHSLVVTNPGEIEGYFRYPDLTIQSIYLAKTILATIKEDIYWEMEFLVKYDDVKSAIQEIVDMPDRDIDLLIKLLHQNKGTLATRKRKHFDKITDQEIQDMEKAFKEVFHIPATAASNEHE